MKRVCVLLSLVVLAYAIDTEITPSVITESEFEDAIFYCSPLSNVTALVVEKRAVGEVEFTSIAANDPNLLRERQSENNREKFTYLQVRRQDNGTAFRCVLGGNPSDAAILNVEFVPTYEKPANQTQEEGGNLTVWLTLEANPYPEFDDFTWERDGQAITPDERVMVGLTYIQIIGLVRSDAGVYSVSATNTEGTGPRVSFILDVQYPPEFAVGFGFGVVCEDGTPIECAVRVGSSTASLDCSVIGNPQPTVTVASNVSETNFRVDENNMVNFTDIVAGNTGIYTCTATNGIGTDATKEFSLEVADVPSITNLAVEVVDSIVAVSWEFSDGGRQLQGFDVDVTVQGVSVYNQAITQDMLPVEGNMIQLNITIGPPEMDTTYTLTVTGRNDLGTGEEQSDTFMLDGVSGSRATVLSVSALTLLLLMIATLVL